MADIQGPRLIVEVDGVSHVISSDGGGAIRAPAPAFVVGVKVAPGDTVRAGDPLVVMETMKMETAITAPFAGTIHEVMVSVNTQVEAGAPLVQLLPSDQQDEHYSGGPAAGSGRPGGRSGRATAVRPACAAICSVTTSTRLRRAN